MQCAHIHSENLQGALGWQLVCYVFENRRVSYSAAIQCLITVGTVAVLFVIVLLAEKRINRDQKHIHIEKKGSDSFGSNVYLDDCCK